MFAHLKAVPRSSPSGEQHRSAELGTWIDGEHLFVLPGTIERLAGDVAQEARGQLGFAGMIAYAAQSGWVDPEGLV
ncbi:hypothetical protein E3O45_02065 [Cryobacterium sp. TMS1-20-1]|uniref:hypothetical protein n=1 Tax=Cryobacterium sp. TMS1-20-1 TaxID=1259223 RepID=UPI00106D552F|nr:hypothetical protein [Cryobacterium sp. TMS1-20-1]TFC80540.1 hypothetical protein E3O45_02065 [Cryobacterium sp. TMS1-20-1]